MHTCLRFCELRFVRAVGLRHPFQSDTRTRKNRTCVVKGEKAKRKERLTYIVYEQIDCRANNDSVFFGKKGSSALKIQRGVKPSVVKEFFTV